MIKTMSHVIYPLLLGKQTINKGMMTYFMDYDKQIWIPNVAWYIKEGTTEILIDTGISEKDVKRYVFRN